MARFELDGLYLSMIRNGTARADRGTPVTAKPPKASEPQQVAAWPGWYWWTGVNGVLYARRPGTSPPWDVRAHNFTALLARIRDKETKGNH